jgi:DtxR family Mn-dependent transcriptional regulator
MTLELSATVQDYVKAIYALQSEAGRGAGAVPPSAIAQRLGVSGASATNMLKKLDSLGLVSHAPYRGAGLTDAGRKIALEVVRHHRLIETYLAEALGVPLDRVHDEAEVLEHALSEELEERISEHLGHPTADPHGHPIPSKDGTMPPVFPAQARRLWEIKDGEETEIDRVPDFEAEALRYLAGVGIKPGAMVEVVGRGPVAGPLFVRVPDESGDVQALSKELAEAVWAS